MSSRARMLDYPTGYSRADRDVVRSVLQLVSCMVCIQGDLMTETNSLCNCFFKTNIYGLVYTIQVSSVGREEVAVAFGVMSREGLAENRSRFASLSYHQRPRPRLLQRLLQSYVCCPPECTIEKKYSGRCVRSRPSPPRKRSALCACTSCVRMLRIVALSDI